MADLTAATSPAPPAAGEPGAALHKRPAFAPPIGSLVIVIGILGALYGIRLYEPFERRLMAIVGVPRDSLMIAGGFAAMFVMGVVYDSIRRRRLPEVPLYLRLNRAFAYGVVGTTVANFVLIARNVAHASDVFNDIKTQLICAGATAVVGAVAYVSWLHPSAQDSSEDLPSYQQAVEGLKNTYDLILGINRPVDWKRGLLGPRSWFMIPELAFYTNIIVLGGIGSGKTSMIVYTVVGQLLGKFENDALRQVSIVLMDLKGDNAKRMYDLSRRFGRDQQFYVVAPGNRLIDTTQAIKAIQSHKTFAPIAHTYTDDDLDAIVSIFTLEGKLPPQYMAEQATLLPVLRELQAAGKLVIKDLIPPDRFLKWNPLAGSQAADIRAAFLLDGISAANDVGSKDGNSTYFENQEGMWLANALALHDNVFGVGRATVKDLYMFANDTKQMQALANHANNDGTAAQAYFKGSFLSRSPEDRDKLISGLKGSLKDLISPTMQSTFCPAHDDPKVLRSFIDQVVNKAGIIVFCVPSAYYTTKVTRVLGIMFMRSFQKQMERRSATQFAATGGNTERLVVQITDEAWAFFNKGVGDFAAVSRQAKTCSLFLSQSLDQIPPQYRSTVQGNFRTSVLLSVNDPLTLAEYSKSYGEVKEMSTSTSTSENLNDAQHGVLTQSVSGKSQGLSVSTSTSERTVPRFSLTDIQHLPARRAVVQMFDGSVVHPAHAIEVLPSFRLIYHLTSPLEHSDVGCRGMPGTQHDYRTGVAGAGVKDVRPGTPVMTCTRCPVVIHGERLDDVREYARRFPHLLSLTPSVFGASASPTPPSSPASPGAST